MLVGYLNSHSAGGLNDPDESVLARIGCQIIYREQKSANCFECPNLSQALLTLKEGDVLVIVKIEHIQACNMSLEKISFDLHSRGVSLRILEGGIDTFAATSRISNRF